MYYNIIRTVHIETHTLNHNVDREVCTGGRSFDYAIDISEKEVVDGNERIGKFIEVSPRGYKECQTHHSVVL